MSITWRPAARSDIDRLFSIRPEVNGEAIETNDAVNNKDIIDFLDYFLGHPFFFSAVVESDVPLQGNRFIGMGLALIVSSDFAMAEIADPRPNILSRILSAVRSGEWVRTKRAAVARANSGEGVDIVIPYCGWRDEILNADQRQEVQTLFVFSLASVLEGFRINRILSETASKHVSEFCRRSIEYRMIADFPQSGRRLYLMTMESATAVPGSIGNVIYRRRQPILRLRPSEQQLLEAALRGATDSELATSLGLNATAVKARWRSVFSRFSDIMPELEPVANLRLTRGVQKRHLALAYLRDHPEELRPYEHV